MSEQWFLRIGEADDRAGLVAVNAEGQLLHGPLELSLAEIARHIDSQAVTVLLPARDIVSCVAEFPATSPSRLRQMLPFSLEDEFAGDVDDLHFAAGERNEAGSLPVSVISRARLDYWIARLSEAGIEPKQILSEADGVADTPAVTTLFVDGPKLLGRRPGGAPFAFEELSLAELWRLLESEREDASDLADVVLFADAATLEQRRGEIDDWRQSIANVNLRELAEGCLPKLAATLVFRKPANLLQGDYAPRSDYLNLIRPWRVAAALLLAVVGLAVIGTAIESVRLGRADEALSAEIDTLCRSRYSSSQESRCRAELLQRLAGSGQAGASGGGYLSMLAAVAAAGGDAIRLEQISFRDRVTTLELIVPSTPFLDTFARNVSGDGAFNVQVTSNTPEEGGGQRARLQIVSSNR